MSKNSNHSVEGVQKPKLAKYFRQNYLSLVVLYNTLHIIAFITKLTGIQVLPMIIIAITLLKIAQLWWFDTFLAIDSKDCASNLGKKLETELTNCVWLLNKINMQTILFTIFLLIQLWIVEKYCSVSISWWIFGNLLILYLGTTRFSRRVIKHQLRLYHEYKKYLIHVIEPYSHEKRDKEDETDSEIEDYSKNQ